MVFINDILLKGIYMKKKFNELELKLLSQAIVEYLMNEISLKPKNISLYAGCRHKTVLDIIDGENFFKSRHFKKLEEAMPEIYVILFNYLLRKIAIRINKKEPRTLNLSNIPNNERIILCITLIEILKEEGK